MISTARRLAFLSMAAFVLIASVAGCAGVTSDRLGGRTFLSTAVTDGGVPRTLIPGTRIRLSFGSDGDLGVSAGCNSMGATYDVQGAVLRIDGGAMTEMGCDEDRMAQDDWVFAFIGAAPTIALTGDSLTLASDSTVVVLMDREVAEPDLSLVGPTWTVDSIIDGGAVSSVPDGVVATLRFAADGAVQVSTGCNQGEGRFVLDGATLRVSDVIFTKRPCMDAAGQMDAAVQAMLDAGSISVAIEAADLTLMAGSSGLGLRGS